MTNRVPRYPLLILCALAGAAAVLSADEPKPQAPRKILLLTGELSPKETVRVFSRVAGVVAKVNFREGWGFKAGDVLAEIDPSEYDLDVQGARARLEAAEAKLAAMEAGGRKDERLRAAADVASAEAVVKTARKNLERVSGLWTKGGSARQQLDDAQKDTDVAQARLVSAKKSLALVVEGPRPEERRGQVAEVNRARVDLKMAELKLSYTKVLAPFDGTIGQRLIDEGAYALAANSPQAPAIAVFSNSSPLKALVDLPEKEMPFIRLGNPARISVQYAPGVTFPATVCNLYPYVDPKTRNGKLELEVPNRPVRLLPGMFVTAEVECAEKPAGSVLEILAGRRPGIGMGSAAMASSQALPATPFTTPAVR